MQNKYLPIGSICTITGSNQKVMITGYSIPHFDGKLVTYDYIGCSYPEGMLANKWFNFQHQQIQNVDFLGFMNEQYRLFCNLLERENKNETETVTPAYMDQVVIRDESQALPQYQFDENGVVTVDPTMEATNIGEYQFDVHQDGTTPSGSVYQFDQNGNVISDTTVGEEAPKHAPLYQFDQNGVVVSDTTVPNQSVYQFDQNGIVIEDLNSSQEPVKSGGFQFDENGVVIAEL